MSEKSGGKRMHLAVVFDRERDIDITQELESHQELASMVRIAVTFEGKLPSGSIPDQNGRPSFTRWCMEHDATFLEWKNNAAMVMIEAKRLEIFECLMRSDFDVRDVIPQERWMAVVERDEHGISSAISVKAYMQP